MPQFPHCSMGSQQRAPHRAGMVAGGGTAGEASIGAGGYSAALSAVSFLPETRPRLEESPSVSDLDSDLL